MAFPSLYQAETRRLPPTVSSLRFAAERFSAGLVMASGDLMLLAVVSGCFRIEFPVDFPIVGKKKGQ